MHSSNVINNNNKKKDITHKNKIQQRYNNNKQRVIDKQLKHEQILKAVKNHLDSDTKNKHSEAMKNIILNHFEINIDKYDLVDAKSATTSILSMFNHNDITDKNIIKEEKQARVKSYMQAYEQSKNENESDIIMDQLLQILNEKDTDSDDDAIMKNINDIFACSNKYHSTLRDKNIEITLKMSLQDLSYRITQLIDITANDNEIKPCRNAMLEMKKAITMIHFEDEHDGPIDQKSQQIQTIAFTVLKLKQTFLKLKHSQFAVKK